MSRSGFLTIVVVPIVTGLFVASPAPAGCWTDLDKLGHVELILVTHGQTDHVVDKGFARSKAEEAKVDAPFGLRDTELLMPHARGFCC